MSSEQQRSGAEKRPSREVLRKVAAVNVVEFVVQREVRTVHLHHDHVVHGHPALRERGLDAIQQIPDFLINVRWRLSCFGVQPNMPGYIERIANQDAVAVGYRYPTLLKVG